jgi:hypothetical protein
MNTRMHRDGLAMLSMALVLAVPCAASAAATPEQTTPSDEELAEILVQGQQPVTDRDLLKAWLRRLNGEFTISGKVLGMSGGQRATGSAVCEGVGDNGGVRCFMKVKATGYGTSFNPGALLFGVDIPKPEIRFMTVDDNGYAASASSELRGDAVRFRTVCAATGGRACMTTTSIYVKSRSEDVSFRVQVEVDGVEQSRIDLTLERRKHDQGD